MSFNQVGRAAVDAILDALVTNKTLKTIGLQGCLTATLDFDAAASEKFGLLPAEGAAGAEGVRNALGSKFGMPLHPQLLELGEQLNSSGAEDVGLTTEGDGAAKYLAFDPKAPEGRYQLDLGQPFERWVAEQLQEASKARKTPWVAYHQPPPPAPPPLPAGVPPPPPAEAAPEPTEAAEELDEFDLEELAERQAERAAEQAAAKKAAQQARSAALAEVAAQPAPPLAPLEATAALPLEGRLHVELRPLAKPTPTTIRYSLALADAAEREVALQLWQTALAESGESWKNERLDGERFELDETDEHWQMPAAGKLELEYSSDNVVFEAQYTLDLADEGSRALAHALAKRATSRLSDEIRQPTLDGAPLPDGLMDQLLHTDGSQRGDEDAHGVLEWTYAVRDVKHVSTRHYVLDLQRGEDAAVAAAMRVWASDVPGENVVRPHIDGVRSHFGTRASAAAKRLPGEGILELDYVVVMPRVALPPPPPLPDAPPAPAPAADGAEPSAPSVSGRHAGYWRAEAHKLRDEDEYEWIVAQRLAQLAYEYPDDPWITAVLPRPRPPEEEEEEEEEEDEMTEVAPPEGAAA